jgi:hypothetical protein
MKEANESIYIFGVKYSIPQEVYPAAFQSFLQELNRSLRK